MEVLVWVPYEFLHLRLLVLIRHEAEGARVGFRQLLLVDDNEATCVSKSGKRFLDRRVLRILKQIVFLLRALKMIVRPGGLLLQVMQDGLGGRVLRHDLMILMLLGADLLLLLALPRRRLLGLATMIQFGILLGPRI